MKRGLSSHLPLPRFPHEERPTEQRRNCGAGRRPRATRRASLEVAAPRPIIAAQEHPAARAQRQAGRAGRGGDAGHAPSAGRRG